MEIKCRFGILNWSIGSVYTCTVDSPATAITKPGTRVKSCNGVHQAGKCNADVEAIYFNSIVVEYFPLGLHKIFPNLKALQVARCGLKEISRRDLMGLQSLTTLYLSQNQLQSLPDNLLDGMTKLTRVSFRSNKLEFASSNLLLPIKNNKLVRVDFRGNPTTIGLYEPGTSSSASAGSLKELGEFIDKNFKKPIGTRHNPDAEDFRDQFVSGFKELWTSKRVSDFVIVCGSKEFQVHKPVLLIQSSVLAAVVESDMRESKTGRMEIEDFSSDSVEDFLKYLYTGETPEQTNAMDLLALASKYNVSTLKTLMEGIVLDNIDETNALEILTLAKQHNCEFLAQAAFNKIQGIFSESNLDPRMINNLETLKQLIEMKRDYEKLLKNCS